MTCSIMIGRLAVSVISIYTNEEDPKPLLVRKTYSEGDKRMTNYSTGKHGIQKKFKIGSKHVGSVD